MCPERHVVVAEHGVAPAVVARSSRSVRSTTSPQWKHHVGDRPGRRTRHPAADGPTVVAEMGVGEHDGTHGPSESGHIAPPSLSLFTRWLHVGLNDVARDADHGEVEQQVTRTATCDEVRSTRLHYRLRCLLHPDHEGEHRWTPELLPHDARRVRHRLARGATPRARGRCARRPGRGEGQGHGEAHPRATTVAVDRDRPTVGGDDLVHDGQAEPGAATVATRARRRGGRSVRRPAHARHRRDAGPVVDDAERDVGTRLRERHRHRASGRAAPRCRAGCAPRAASWSALPSTCAPDTARRVDADARCGCGAGALRRARSRRGRPVHGARRRAPTRRRPRSRAGRRPGVAGGSRRRGRRARSPASRRAPGARDRPRAARGSR